MGKEELLRCLKLSKIIYLETELDVLEVPKVMAFSYANFFSMLVEIRISQKGAEMLRHNNNYFKVKMVHPPNQTKQCMSKSMPTH